MLAKDAETKRCPFISGAGTIVNCDPYFCMAWKWWLDKPDTTQGKCLLLCSGTVLHRAGLLSANETISLYDQQFEKQEDKENDVKET